MLSIFALYKYSLLAYKNNDYRITYKKMNLVMTLLVRDEEDILQSNIEFHLAQGVDFIIATDNLSVDSTPKILKHYERKGVLHYIHENNDNYNQHEWVTRMARLAYANYNADWVINNDADEFWWPREATLKETFSKIQADINVVLAQRTNFVYLPEKSTTTPFYKNMVYRQKVSLNPLGESLPPKVAHRGSNSIIVNQGNHSITGCGQQNVIDNVIDILHFPLRRYDQYLKKIAVGGAAYQRNEQLPIEIGKTWRELHQQYRVHGNLDMYMKDHAYDNKRIDEELHTGHLVKDVRLKNFLEDLL